MDKGYDKQRLKPTTGSWTLPPSLVWAGIINLKVDRKIISNQEIVAEISANHFATTASDIGDVKLRNSSESDWNNHPSVLHIRMANSSKPMIKSNPVTMYKSEMPWSHLIREKQMDVTICQPEYWSMERKKNSLYHWRICTIHVL